MQVLRLNNNEIGDEGMRSLSDALVKGALPACTTCMVFSNPASDEAQQAVEDALASRTE